ncbi:10510_t:CDS:2, partial [Racocetra persica]
YLDSGNGACTSIVHVEEPHGCWIKTNESQNALIKLETAYLRDVLQPLLFFMGTHKDSATLPLVMTKATIIDF